MAVHDVHVKNGRSGALDLGDLLPQMRKIRRKDGWEDFNHCKAILAHRQKPTCAYRKPVCQLNE
jgi:hypothetical protein